MSLPKRRCKRSADPAVNAYIEGADIVYHDYIDIGVVVVRHGVSWCQCYETLNR